MRQLAGLRFAIVLFLTTGSILAAEDRGARRPSGNSWIDAARDYIVRKPTLRPAESCGSPLACSLVIANASARCESVGAGRVFVARPTLHLYGALYYYPGRMNHAKPAVDATVVDGPTAIAHEYDWHIIPAAIGVTPLLEHLQSRRFTSRTACEAGVAETSAAILVQFREILAETQRHELTSGTRPQTPIASLQ